MKKISDKAKMTIIVVFTVLYAILWAATAYLPGDVIGPSGFPLWFSLSCIYLPIVFIVAIFIVIFYIFDKRID